MRQLERLDLEKKILRRVIPRNATGCPQIKAALADAAAGTERALQRRFEEFLQSLARAEGNDAVEQPVKKWREDVEAILLDELRRACALIVAGSPLRRLEAIQSAEQELRDAMARWAQAAAKQDKPAGANQRARRPKGKNERGEP